MMPLLLKSLVGAVAVLLIALAAQSRYFVLAGLVPLFPTFALISHVMVGSQRPAAELQRTALFGLWSLAPYAAYLVAVYWLSVRAPLWQALTAATALWCGVAGLMLLLWFHLYPA